MIRYNLCYTFKRLLSFYMVRGWNWHQGFLHL